MSVEQEHLNNLIPDAREALNESDESRINYLNVEKFIKYDKAKQILDKLGELLSLPKKTRMPCLLIVGESDNGKTSTVKRFERDHPPTNGRLSAAMPVVRIEAPFHPDVHLLYDEILKTILIPFKKSDSYSKKEEAIQYHFTTLGVKMLIIDEIHNILSGSVAKQKAFMNAVKGINNKLMLPIVLVGTKDALNATNTDMQISSRFRPILLPLWKLDRDYVSLLASIEQTLPLKRASNLSKNRELAQTILDMSEGILGEIAYIITELGILAVKTGQERISSELLKSLDFVKPSRRKGLEMVEAGR